MFQKILIANRGEIACRVIKTARRMGVATVAVYSDADREARHVALADEAVHIGAAPSRESYLAGDRIIAACRATGAQALHPGYGFLSENEDFARRVEEQGIVFIGPKHDAIAAMGDKIASKKLAAAANVSTIPGHNDVIAAPEAAVKIARDIGYPVMIKASAGGGGKGLRVAWNDQEAFDGFASCRNEARAAFGDDRVFIEKFVENPRHIEIQVLGDAHGNVVYLWERECSIQRRHQKVVEEAPSPFLDEATRRAMGEQAVALARAVKYQSAGTVEFVVGRDRSFYFLEMNTRLQVEHPVTESITGIDLVEQMIRVAAGEKLAFTQDRIPRLGWAIECRINAEDPERGFLPSTGRLTRFMPPATSIEAGEPRRDLAAPGNAGDADRVASKSADQAEHLAFGGANRAEHAAFGGANSAEHAAFGGANSAEHAAFGGVRVDTGVYEGGEIPMFYDSMIAKLIVHAPDRAQAIARMREALNAFVVRGVASNVGFQAALLAHPRFAAGDFDTGFIAQQYPDGYRAHDVAHEDPDFLVALAAGVYRRYRDRAAGISGQLAGHGVRIGSDFVVVVKDRQGRHRHVPVKVAVNGATHVSVGDKSYAIAKQWSFGAVRATGTCNGRPFTAQIERHGLWYRVVHDGARIDAMVVSPRASELLRVMPTKALPDTSKFLLSPMPGLLVQLAVQPGQTVRSGERLAVIEAMKMENVLTAAQDSTVAELLASQGESLAVDQPILRFA